MCKPLVKRFLLAASALPLAAAGAAAQCPKTAPFRTVYLEISGAPLQAPQLDVAVIGSSRAVRVAEPKGVRWTLRLPEPATVARVKVEPLRAGFHAVPQGEPWLDEENGACVAVFPFRWEEVWNVSVASEPAQLLATAEVARGAKGVERANQRTNFTVKSIPLEAPVTIRLHAPGGSEVWPIVLRRSDFSTPVITTPQVRQRICANTPADACNGRMMRLGVRKFTLTLVRGG